LPSEDPANIILRILPASSHQTPNDLSPRYAMGQGKADGRFEGGPYFKKGGFVHVARHQLHTHWHLHNPKKDSEKETHHTSVFKQNGFN
jgi:hypothetical protein